MDEYLPVDYRRTGGGWGVDGLVDGLGAAVKIKWEGMDIPSRKAKHKEFAYPRKW